MINFIVAWLVGALCVAMLGVLTLIIRAATGEQIDEAQQDETSDTSERRAA